MDKWPLVFISVGLIVGAVIDGWKFKVPNWLTFPLVITGWLLGTYYWLAGVVPFADDTTNRLVASLLGTFLAFLFLLPVYVIGGMGEGDVKLLMGCGAWMGAYYGSHHGSWLLFYSFACGVLVGGVIASLMMIPRFKSHMETTRAILKDLATSKGNIGNVAQKAAERKPNLLLLPYGVPLTIGIVSYIWLNVYGLLPAFLTP